MMGTLIRNEKRAASSRRRPRKSPSVIVAPERETPGTSAAACASPIPIASENLSLSAPRVLLPTASPTMNSTPTSTRLKTTTQGLRTDVSKKSSRKNPIRAAGMVEARIRYASRWSGSEKSLPPGVSERANAPAIRSRSRQKKETTATSVPRCSATSKGSPKRSWSSPRKYCPRSRCPELETGKNSVSPCTTPSSIASRTSSTSGTPPSGRGLSARYSLRYASARFVVSTHRALSDLLQPGSAPRVAEMLFKAVPARRVRASP